ncbi:signal transduction histidine kinase [Alkalibaculum bacchi]|uniref:histidine kinase n=1 Tax=Alkalibaculum bacchi TaxID=645887 RepID=A0A366IBI8_9FIRM|nr:HAMP domain-containing sensor histidine kinase [Alkalibaculum bacchi]RBP66029.1 signal transduction histidine kinase [Alkalibaculum bacchi]
MLIKKKEIIELSDNIRSAIDGKDIDFRDNREGPFSILRNDINTLVHIKNEQMNSAQLERDLLADYLADISHQLKTPITSMMIMAELLDTAPVDKQKEFIGNIKISLVHMEWLVSTLLKMARLDSGAVDFSRVTIQAGELIKSALKPLGILLDVKNQSVEILNDTELSCDKRWTVEALTNLLKNASEYSPVNSKIYVNSGVNPIYSWISITDSGEGLRKEQYASLFKRFEYSKSEKGYGIGLPLALSIVRGQNGDIEIDGGGHGKGATFSIKFYK